MGHRGRRRVRGVRAQEPEPLRNCSVSWARPYRHRHALASVRRRFPALVSGTQPRRAELELVALRRQVTVLRRQRSGRLRLFSADRTTSGTARLSPYGRCAFGPSSFLTERGIASDVHANTDRFYRVPVVPEFSGLRRVKRPVSARRRARRQWPPSRRCALESHRDCG